MILIYSKVGISFDDPHCSSILLSIIGLQFNESCIHGAGMRYEEYNIDDAIGK